MGLGKREDCVMTRMSNIASFSGGKDSTAMVLKLIENNCPLDEIVFFDTGWEFPQMYDHIEQFEEYIGRKITRLHPPESFDYIMRERPIVRRKKGDIMHGKIYKHGHGWPSNFRRWCTREKVDVIDKYCLGADRYCGYAADEAERCDNFSGKRSTYTMTFPLIEWNMTESDCLKICYERGFKFGGLYEHFSRVSCFCCPLKGLKDYRTMRTHFPELWVKMLESEAIMTNEEGKRFHHGKSVADLDERFANEDSQQILL